MYNVKYMYNDYNVFMTVHHVIISLFVLLIACYCLFASCLDWNVLPPYSLYVLYTSTLTISESTPTSSAVIMSLGSLFYALDIYLYSQWR